MINIREKTAVLLWDKYGITEEQTEQMFRDQVLNEKYCIRLLVANEYAERSKGPTSKIDIKVLLSERYCVSYSTVEKYIQQILNGSAP